MVKFIAALLFAQVLLAAPMPQQEETIQSIAVTPTTPEETNQSISSICKFEGKCVNPTTNSPSSGSTDSNNDNPPNTGVAVNNVFTSLYVGNGNFVDFWSID